MSPLGSGVSMGSMAALAPVELIADCPACGLEGGVVEVYDALVPACRFGLPASTRCKLCAAESHGAFDRPPARALHEIAANRCPACLRELGPSAIDARRCPSCHACAALAERVPPASFATLAELERALDRWAGREGFASQRALVTATFVEHDVAKLFDALRRGKRLEVLADPFANMGVRTTGGTGRGSDADPLPADAMRSVPSPAPESITHHDLQYAPTDPLAPPLAPPPPAPVPPLVVTVPPPPSAPPRAIVFPLVSVVAADGEIHPEERALVDRFLQAEGLAPLADHEFAVHHPSEVAHLVPPERREEVVRLMCETAAIDGMPDESERRVIRAYAAAWHVDDEKLEFWMWGYESMNTSLARQLFMKLRRFVLSARWGETEKPSIG